MWNIRAPILYEKGPQTVSSMCLLMLQHMQESKGMFSITYQQEWKAGFTEIFSQV